MKRMSFTIDPVFIHAASFCVLCFLPVSTLVWFARRSHKLVLKVLKVMDGLGFSKDHWSVPVSRLAFIPD